MNVISTVKKLESLFKEKGFSLYFVGGSVRDYLLFNDFDDVDLVTDATTSEIKAFIENADFTFEKFGFVKVKFDDCKFDITTLRIEEGYSDFRHPKTIRFTKKLEEDVLRRDFTINGLYMSTDLRVYDYVGGVDDLNSKVIKMIGDPLTRIKEDPLRIIRAIRFALTYKFKIDEELSKVMKQSISLLDELNPDKIKQDIKKIKNASNEEISKVFIEYNIQKYIDVIK